MMLKKWEELPVEMQTNEVKEYYDILSGLKFNLFLKRLFDIVVSTIMIIVLFPLFIIVGVAIKIDSKGPVFYRQIRITQYAREYRIFKFRTMVQNADKILQVTVKNDSRITRVGKLIRKCRLDEVPQLFDIFRGTMTFVGTRPEVPKYVDGYTPEMMATLLLPAGVTSLASIYFKDEDVLLSKAEDIDSVYLKTVLPQKMKWNLFSIKEFSILSDIKIMFMTIFAILGKKYESDFKSISENTREVERV